MGVACLVLATAIPAGAYKEVPPPEKVVLPLTSACGVMVYRDELLGANYAGNVFVCEPVHNLVSRQILRPTGVTFKGERAT